jgi:hypothetical protein
MNFPIMVKKPSGEKRSARKFLPQRHYEFLCEKYAKDEKSGHGFWSFGR